MSDDILPIPAVPDGLREASQRGTLIPFVGAGASVIAGCPRWSQFADGALAQFVESDKISHAEIAQINHLHPRVKLSIARGLEAEHRIPIDFRKLLHTSGRNSNLRGRELYGSLSKLGKTFVTTNYDEWLDEEIDSSDLRMDATTDPRKAPEPRLRNVYHRVEDLTAANLNQSNTVTYRVVKNERLADPYTDEYFASDLKWLKERIDSGEERNLGRPGWGFYVNKVRVATFYGTKNWDTKILPEIKLLVAKYSASARPISPPDAAQ